MKNNLLKDIYSYYPIGSGIARPSYSGFDDILSILKQKYNMYKIQDKHTGIFKIGEMLSTQGIGYLPAFYDFPSHGLSIFLGETESNNIKTVCQLKLRISMLTNSFTLFYEEVISNNNFHPTIPFNSFQLSKQHFGSDPDQKILNLVKNTVTQCFHDMPFADPILLFTNKVGKGIPYGIDDNPAASNYYSIYDYLYGSDYSSFSSLNSDFSVAQPNITIVPY